MSSNETFDIEEIDVDYIEFRQLKNAFDGHFDSKGHSRRGTPFSSHSIVVDQKTEQTFWITDGGFRYATLVTLQTASGIIDGERVKIKGNFKNFSCLCTHEDKLLVGADKSVLVFSISKTMPIEPEHILEVGEDVKGIYSMGKYGGCVLGEDTGLYYFSMKKGFTKIENKVQAASILPDSHLVALISKGTVLKVYSADTHKMVLNCDLPIEGTENSRYAIHFPTERTVLVGIDGDVLVATIDIRAEGGSVLKWSTIHDPARANTELSHQLIFSSIPYKFPGLAPKPNGEGGDYLTRLVVIGDEASSDVVCGGLMGRKGDSAYEEFKLFFIVSEQGLIQMPFSIVEKEEDTTPYAIVFDFSATKSIPSNDPGSPPLPPQPIIHIVSSDGVICSYHIVKLDETKPHPLLMKATTALSGSEPTAGVPKVASPVRSMKPPAAQSVLLATTLPAANNAANKPPFGSSPGNQFPTLVPAPKNTISNSTPTERPSPAPASSHLGVPKSLASVPVTLAPSLLTVTKELDGVPLKDGKGPESNFVDEAPSDAEQLLIPELAILTESHGPLQNLIAKQFVEIQETFTRDINRTTTSVKEAHGKMERCRPIFIEIDKISDDLAISTAKVESEIRATIIQEEKIDLLLKDISCLKSLAQIHSLSSLERLPSVLDELHKSLDEIEATIAIIKNGDSSRKWPLLAQEHIAPRLKEMNKVIQRANLQTSSAFIIPSGLDKNKVGLLHQSLRSKDPKSIISTEAKREKQRMVDSVTQKLDVLSICVPLPKSINLPRTEISAALKPVTPVTLSQGKLTQLPFPSAATPVVKTGSTPPALPEGPPQATSTKGSIVPTVLPLFADKASPLASLHGQTPSLSPAAALSEAAIGDEGARAPYPKVDSEEDHTLIRNEVKIQAASAPFLSGEEISSDKKQPLTGIPSIFGKISPTANILTTSTVADKAELTPDEVDQKYSSLKGSPVISKGTFEFDSTKKTAKGEEEIVSPEDNKTGITVEKMKVESPRQAQPISSPSFGFGFGTISLKSEGGESIRSDKIQEPVKAVWEPEDNASTKGAAPLDKSPALGLGFGSLSVSLPVSQETEGVNGSTRNGPTPPNIFDVTKQLGLTADHGAASASTSTQPGASSSSFGFRPSALESSIPFASSIIGESKPFGSSPSGTSLFGSATATLPSFGQSSTLGNATPAFGQSTPTVVGGSAPIFGQPTAIPSFGQPRIPSSGAPSFGQPSALGGNVPTFQQTSSFGLAAPGTNTGAASGFAAYAKPPAGASIFGSASQAPPQSSTPQQGSLFGPASTNKPEEKKSNLPSSFTQFRS